MRKHKKSIMAFSLVFVMLTSCGSHFDAPQLEEPISAVEPYYTVTRGNVGKIEVMPAVVTAKPYCQFWKTRVAVKEVKVEFGQHVKVGDVLAVADYEMAQKQCAEIQNEIGRIQSIYSQTSKKYDVMEEEYKYTLKGAKEIGDKATEKEMNQRLKELEECRKYDKALCGIQVSGCNKEVEELQKVMNDTNLVADHEGYVSYVKDIDADNMVSKEDNVVIISDYNDTYIETTQPVGVRFKPFETIYVTDNGVRHDLKAINYSENELMIASNEQLNITRRYVYEDGTKLPEIGKMLYIVQKHESADNVIVIDKSYLFEDEEGVYTYVMNGDASEKRYLTIGLSDTRVREVKAGLEEGEKVLAKGDPIMPSQYTEVTAEYGSLILTEMNNKILTDNRKADVQKFYGSGMVKQIATDGEAVKKGEVICKITTDDGGAVLNEKRVQMQRVGDGHDAEIEALDDQIKKLKKQLNALKDIKKETKKETAKEEDKKTTDEKVDTPDVEETPHEEGTATPEIDRNEEPDNKGNNTKVATLGQGTGLDEVSVHMEKPQLLGAELEGPSEEASETEMTTESTEADTEAVTETPTTSEEVTEATTEAATETTTEATVQTTSEQNAAVTTEAAKTEQSTSPEKKDEKITNSKDMKNPAKKPMNPYQKEILQCQIEELEIDKAISRIDYSYTISAMQRDYDDAIKGNDGSGEKTFIAEEDCVIRRSYCSRGDRVDYGDRIFSIVKEGNPKVVIKNKDHYALNQSVDIVIDGDVKYKGKIINDNALSGVYITTKDGEVFITHNTDEAQKSYIMTSDDKNLYTDVNAKTAKIVIGDYNGVVVVPSRAVYETKRNGKEDVLYVWKKVGDSWNMQIITAVYMQIEESGYYAILDGVDANDIVAMQD